MLNLDESQEITQEEIQIARKIVKEFYKDENGNPIILTDGQCEIFILIFKRKFPRNHLKTYTQYGKSFTVALAILTRAATYPEKWAILAGRESQARIIMGYIIQHSFDHPYLKNKLQVQKDESIERIQRERSKKRMTFRHTDKSLSEVFVLSGDSRNKQTAGDAVMGFGSPNVVLDEAALIDDDIEAKIFRMLGAQTDNFYLKIGNPFRRNHFYKDSKNPSFFHLSIDYEQGIREGRITQEFIEEARSKPFFDVLYENKFPLGEVMDEKGWVPLFAESDIRQIPESSFIGRKRMGIDPSGAGSDETKWVVRDDFKAKVVATEKISTTKSIAEKTMTLMEELQIKDRDITVDNFGVGANVAQELALNRIRVNAVNVGDKDLISPEKFLNLRAEASWRLREWLRKGGELIQDLGWDELLDIKYKAEGSGKMKVISKEELRREGILSPNTYDALLLTFCEPENTYQNTEIIEVKEFNRYNPI